MKTVLNITGDEEEEFSLQGKEPTAVVAPDGTYEGAKGGTEMMRDELFKRINEIDPELIAEFNWIFSRVPDDLQNEKLNLLWLHDTWDDPQTQHLKDIKSRERFGKLIFVSNYQQWTYVQGLGIPYMEGIVMKNAIAPIEKHDKPKDGPIKLIYHTTPHRGLDILVAVFEKLYSEVKQEIELDVYSSFDIYGWKGKDDQYREIFDRCEAHPGINYHGYQPNDVVREALKTAHIYAYPNIWPETSCISVIEAMSAGCAVVCPSFAALPETTANWASMYPYQEHVPTHAQLFLNVTNNIIHNFWDDSHQQKLSNQKAYTDMFYSWDLRIHEWQGLLIGLRDAWQDRKPQ
jgi:glycosyltransferase involved in cell wall biosynthesis